MRVVTLNAAGGYDTHSDEAEDLGKYLAETCAGVMAFQRDLEARGLDDRVMIEMWSEFGRRPQENGSAGTDHGAAGAAFVIGSQSQGQMVGEFPGLATLDANENLRVTSDFRGDVLLAAGAVAGLRLGRDHPRRRGLRKTETGPGVKRLLGAAALAALALCLGAEQRRGRRPGPRRLDQVRLDQAHQARRQAREASREGATSRARSSTTNRAERSRCRKKRPRRPARPRPSPGCRPPRAKRRPRPPTPEPEANAVSITANDHTNPYGYAPSRKTVKSGELTVQLINVGEDEHNMDMEKVGPGNAPEGPIVVAVSAASKGASTPTRVDVEPGTYRMWCTLPGHAEKGMETTTSRSRSSVTVTETATRSGAAG